MMGDEPADVGGIDSDRTAAQSPGDGTRASRRSVLAAVAGLATAGLTAGSAGAFGRTRDVPVPHVEGPVTGGSRTGGPQTAAPHEIERFGYVEEEFFISGDARHVDFFVDGENAEDTAAYKTRILVYRPEHPWRFNGAVYAEWLNVSTGIDAPVSWPNAYESLMRNGTAVALVSAQKVGVDGSFLDPPLDLVSWDPARYGTLNHPGDEYALDIFAQAVNALSRPGQGWARRRGDPDPMGKLGVRDALATGHSQSAFFLLGYINLVAPTYDLVDGFLPSGSFLTTARADQAPILWLNTEDEVGGFPDDGGDDDDDGFVIPPEGLRLDQLEPGPREDRGLFKLWEVAGASHVNTWLSAWSEAFRRRDFFGLPPNWDPEASGDYGQQQDGNFGECGFNYFPARWAFRVGLEQLREWVKRGDEPPRADRIERTVDDQGDVAIVRDEFGNAKGGLRLPPIDVPVATYDARTCGLFGRTIQFDDATLADLYPSRDDYVDAIREASVEAVLRGHMLPDDARELVRRAEESSIGT